MDKSDTLSTGGRLFFRCPSPVQHRGRDEPGDSGRRDADPQGGWEVSIAAVTLTGFVAIEPKLLFTKQTQTPVVNLRVGTTPRRIDVTTGEWRDLPSSFFTVNCWRRLAYSVSASLHKGDPVIIRGRLKSRTWNDNGVMRSAVDIEADSVGHDMAYGWAHYMKGLHPSTEDMLKQMGITDTPYGTESARDFESGSGYEAARQYDPAREYEPAREGGPANGAEGEAAEGTAEDSASPSDGALAAGEVPF
jgi:single-strand DNA-binding protein